MDVPEYSLAAVRALYVERLGALDYGGLQREAVRLLQENDNVRRIYADGFRCGVPSPHECVALAEDTGTPT